MFNLATIVGWMSDKPKCYTSAQGLKMIKFNVYTNESDKLEYHSCVAFGKLSEIIQKYGGAKQLVIVTGRNKTSKYKNKEQKEIWNHEIVVETFKLGYNKEIASHLGLVSFADAGYGWDGEDPSQGSGDIQNFGESTVGDDDIPF